MAKPKNRSPWMVKLPGQEPQKFRLKSKAPEYLAENGRADPEKLPRGALNHLESAFEVQVIRKDKLAEPPIKRLTFHSMRKIGAKATSKRVNNAMEPRRLTGHRDVEVLHKRWYGIQMSAVANIKTNYVCDGNIQR